jgi:hypothetical protein
MKTGMTRLGGRSPSRTLAVPAVPYLRLAARGGQPVAPARARGATPDIIELILADHERIRRLLRGDDDTARYREDPGCPGARPGVMPVRRWPAATPVALELRVRALFAAPLHSGAIRIGVLLAHRDAQGPMDGGVLADLLVFAHAGT